MTLPEAANSDSFERFFPMQLRIAEEKLVNARRKAADPGEDPLRETVGIACSGGGIRSATFCLGFFQAVAKANLLHKVDYISTISGGGYFGSFLGSLFVHSAVLAKPLDATGSNPDRQYASTVLSDTQSAPLQWLREHGRYIAPNGPADYGNIVAIFVRNWAAVQFVTAVAFLALFLALIELRSLLYLCPQIAHHIVEFSNSAQLGYWHSSPTICLPIVVLALGAIPLGIAFWLTQYQGNSDSTIAQLIRSRIRGNYPLYALLVIALAFVAMLFFSTRFGLQTAEIAILVLLLIAPGLALAYWIISEIGIVSSIRNTTARPSSSAGGRSINVGQRQSMVRNLLSDRLATTLWVIAVVSAIGFFDSAAESTYSFLASLKTGLPTMAWGVAAAVAPLVHRLGPLLKRSQKAGDGISWWTLLEAAGWALYGIVVIGWGVLAYAVAFRGNNPDWMAHRDSVSVTALAFLGLTLFLNGLTGRTMTFLNLSSLQSFYSARLRRAYLGAANPTRIDEDETAPRGLGEHKATESSIRLDVLGDDMPWSRYRPNESGGPLHLLGVTVNHTVDEGSDLELRDRKGFLMTAGPAGLTAGDRSHALWDGNAIAPIPILDVNVKNLFGSTKHGIESLSLSRWVAVSGAAFSTGLGARTKTGISLLMALANVRLGYWWQARDDGDRDAGLIMRLFRAQCYLLVDEFFGRFPGSQRADWYLTDGGHSENTGAYELVRRRVPVIVVLDNGADPDYSFEDFGNLVRRVRIDFDVEIVESSAAERTGSTIAGLIGSLEELGRMPPTPPSTLRLSKKAIALFDVIHRNPDIRTSLILVKPTLVGDEPRDVTYYATEHAAFPQEPTADQFFDEPQWESYRCLGEHIGTKLLQQYQLTGQS